MIAARDLSVSYYLKLIPIDPVCHMLSNEYPGKATFRKIHKLSMIVCVYATYDANEGGESHFDVIGVISNFFISQNQLVSKETDKILATC